jgi:glutathione synthase/RimK-type ligase-like ATP-grasp enzyme
MNITVLHTASGGQYARAIARSVRFLCERHHEIEAVETRSVNELYGWNPGSNTTIIARAAYPSMNGWMGRLKQIENNGAKAINAVDVLRLTSDKGDCSGVLLKAGVPHPRTWIYTKGSGSAFLDEVPDTFIAKPITSRSQGASVIKYTQRPGSREYTLMAIGSVPGDTVVIQEVVPYTALHRVIVIGGVALPYTFVDRVGWHAPEDWKLSVCLNRTTMQFVGRPDSALLDVAERAQRAVGAEISFVDVFETAAGYVMSEINTACNLTIHEELARSAGLTDWNIHYRIARYAVLGR